MLGLTPHGWTALVLGVLVVLAIAFAFTREYVVLPIRCVCGCEFTGIPRVRYAGSE